MTTLLVLVDRFGEPLRRLDNRRITAKRLNQRLHILEPIEEAGVFLRNRNQLPALGLLPFLELVDGTMPESLVTPHAERFIPRRLPITTRTVQSSDRLGALLLDIEAMCSRDFAVAGFAEHGDIAGGSIAPTAPTVVVLKNRLRHPLTCKMRRTTLPEIGERDRLMNIRSGGRFPGNLPTHLVGHLLATLELTPQRRRIVALAGVGFEPSAQERRRRDQYDRPLSALPVHADLEAVTVVRDISNRQGEQLLGSGAGVPCDGDKRLVASVQTGVKHWPDVVFPVQHFAGVGGRVIVAAGGARDPSEGFGDAVVVSMDVDGVGFGDALAEHPEGDPVVFVRFFVVVFAVDPADDLLGDAFVFDGVDEAAALLGDDDTVAEELLVSLVAVFGVEESEAMAECKQKVAVGGVAASFAVLQLGDEAVECSLRVCYHCVAPSLCEWELNLGFSSRLGRFCDERHAEQREQMRALLGTHVSRGARRRI